MTVYRAVCPRCTAYIKSRPVRDDADMDEWAEEADRWLSEHRCGLDLGDGIERSSEYRLYEESWRDRDEELDDLLDGLARAILGRNLSHVPTDRDEIMLFLRQELSRVLWHLDGWLVDRKVLEDAADDGEGEP